MKVVLTREQLSDVINDLKGSCQDLGSVLQEVAQIELDDVAEESLLAIDDEIFLCDQCGWWCDLDEMAEDREGICTDCVE